MSQKTQEQIEKEKAARKVAVDAAEKAWKECPVDNPDNVVKSMELHAAFLKAQGEAEVKNFEEKLAAIEAAQKEAKEADAATLKEISERLEVTIKAFDMFQIHSKKSKVESREKSFGAALGEILESKKDDLKNYQQKGRGAITMEVKAVGDMASSSLTISGTNTFAGPDSLGGVGRKPYEITHIRNLPGVSVTPINSDSAFVIRDAGGEGGPTAVAMGVTKPQTDRDYVKLIQPVTKIAHYFKIPEEMLADLPWLLNEITSVGVEELLAKEDDLILNQLAGAGLFAGLTTATNSTAFAAPAALALGIDLANNYDVLVAAQTQLKGLNVGATLGIVNPQDYAKMILTKVASTGEYVFGAPNVAIPNVFGMPLISTNKIASDKFLIGDFSKVRIGQRAGVSVRIYDQNEDDAINNMVTIVIEERLTVVVDRADRLIYGDFSDARAALETA